MSCFWRHRWSKWIDKENLRQIDKDAAPSAVGLPLIVQERRCAGCNRVELRFASPWSL